MSFFNVMMLAGLAAVAIPPIIHFLNRRRYEVVDWGAMQFLQISEITRRRLLIEELLLMLLRMGLIAVLVLTWAGPYSDKYVFVAPQRPSRDVVLLFDGSASMSFKGSDKSAQDRAKEWARTFIDDLNPGDGVALVVVRKQPEPLLGKLTIDLQRVREHLDKLPEPGGSCDWPRALQAAYAILDTSQHGDRDIIVISDGQRFGWSDDRALLGWEDLAARREGARIKPGVWVVNLDPKRPEKPANWSLDRLHAGHAVAVVNKTVSFHSALRLTGQNKYEPPYEVRLSVDGRFVKNLDMPKEATLESGQVPFSFTHTFATPGSHLVTVVVHPDPPAEKRQPGQAQRDHLPIDNRQDLSVEVLDALPVLIVDGDDAEKPRRRGSDFLEAALAAKKDRAPAARVKVVPLRQFNAALLSGDTVATRDNPKKDGNKDIRPRVVVFSNVPRLTEAQQRAVEDFLRTGGGVLVALGNRADKDAFNAMHRGGQGWLPARLDKIAGDEADLSKAARPLPATFYHPALEKFRRPVIGGLDTTWFSRWWQVSPPEKEDGGSVVARLNKDGDPFLVERRLGQGHVLLCTVPLDESWRTDVTGRMAYVPLAQELVYYLAGARSADYNPEPGQSLRYRLPRGASQQGLTLQAPSDKAPRSLAPGAEDGPDLYSARVVEQPQGDLLVHEGLREPGIWKLTTADKQTVYYAVQPDPREADLSPVRDEDRKKVEKQTGEKLSFNYENDATAVLAGLSKGGQRQEFWDWFLIAVVGLLCIEVWFTRRIVKNRA
jgi:von Willebrand factor type A domain/Aerotolerance regulator N-terminal